MQNFMNTIAKIESFLPSYTYFLTNSYLIFAYCLGFLLRNAILLDPSATQIFKMQKGYLAFASLKYADDNPKVYLVTNLTIGKNLGKQIDEVETFIKQATNNVSSNESVSLKFVKSCYQTPSGLMMSVCEFSVLEGSLSNVDLLCLERHRSPLEIGKLFDIVVIDIFDMKTQLSNMIDVALQVMGNLNLETEAAYQAYLIPWISGVNRDLTLCIVPGDNQAMLSTFFATNYNESPKHVTINSNCSLSNEYFDTESNDTLVLPICVDFSMKKVKTPIQQINTICNSNMSLLEYMTSYLGNTLDVICFNTKLYAILSKVGHLSTGNLTDFLIGTMLVSFNEKNHGYYYFYGKTAQTGTLTVLDSFSNKCLTLSFGKIATNVQKRENNDNNTLKRRVTCSNFHFTPDNMEDLPLESYHNRTIYLSEVVAIEGDTFNCTTQLKKSITPESLVTLLNKNGQLFIDSSDIVHVLLGALSQVYRNYELFHPGFIRQKTSNDTVLIHKDLSRKEINDYINNYCFHGHVTIFQVEIRNKLASIKMSERDKILSQNCNKRTTTVAYKNGTFAMKNNIEPKLDFVMKQDLRNNSLMKEIVWLTHRIRKHHTNHGLLLYALLLNRTVLFDQEMEQNILIDYINLKHKPDEFLKRELQVQYYRKISDIHKLYNSFTMSQHFLEINNLMFTNVQFLLDDTFVGVTDKLEHAKILKISKTHLEIWKYETSDMGFQYKLTHRMSFSAKFATIKNVDTLPDEYESTVHVYKSHTPKCVLYDSFVTITQFRCEAMSRSYSFGNRHEGITFLCNLRHNNYAYKTAFTISQFSTCYWYMKLFIVDHLELINASPFGKFVYELVDTTAEHYAETSLTIVLPRKGTMIGSTHVISCGYMLQHISEITYKSEKVLTITVLFEKFDLFKITVKISGDDQNIIIILVLSDGHNLPLYPREKVIFHNENVLNSTLDILSNYDLGRVLSSNFPAYSLIGWNQKLGSSRVTLHDTTSDPSLQIFSIKFNREITNIELFATNVVFQINVHIQDIIRNTTNQESSMLIIENKNSQPGFRLISLNKICWLLKEYEGELLIKSKTNRRKQISLALYIVEVANKTNLIYIGSIKWFANTHMEKIYLELESVFILTFARNGYPILIKSQNQKVPKSARFIVLQPEGNVRPVAYVMKEFVSEFKHFKIRQSLIIRFELGIKVYYFYLVLFDFFACEYSFPGVSIEFKNEIIVTERDIGVSLV